jgi:hypothetical protein
MRAAINSSIIVALSAVLAGCFVSPWHGGTTPAALEKAKAAPQERLLAFQERKETTTATLVVTRDKGALGGACYYAVEINGKLAARLDIAETSRFYMEPGKVLLRAGRDPLGKGLCAIAQEEWTQSEILLKSGETKHVRLSTDFYGFHIK